MQKLFGSKAGISIILSQNVIVVVVVAIVAAAGDVRICIGLDNGICKWPANNMGQCVGNLATQSGQSTGWLQTEI